MLRVSSEKTERTCDLNMINGVPGGASDIEFGMELMHFAESLAMSLVGGDEVELDRARSQLLEVAGPDVLVDAAGVAGNFQRMVRIADAMGIPVDSMDDARSNEIRNDLDLYRFASAGNSAGDRSDNRITSESHRSNE